MSPAVRRRLPFLVVSLVLVAVGAVAWQSLRAARAPGRAPQNAILIIAPYEYQGTWVFDDAAAGLTREPFVAGIPEMIDVLVEDVPDAKAGFRLLFSAREFPGFQKKLTWARSDGSGNYYRLEEPPMEGWICPALFKYYETAPEELFVRAEPLRRG
jgi:hypothetical protein